MGAANRSLYRSNKAKNFSVQFGRCLSRAKGDPGVIGREDLGSASQCHRP